MRIRLIVLALILTFACILVVGGRQRHSFSRQDRYWEQAEHEIRYRSPAQLKAQHEDELSRGIFFKEIIHGNPAIRSVALTFDDGPHPDFTPKILKILKDNNVKATFFVIGKMVERYPDGIRLMIKDGDTVGNHSFHHVNLTKLTYSQVRLEWQATNDVIWSITNHDTDFCRPPGGDYNQTVIDAATAEGITTVLWTDDPADYAEPGSKHIESRVLWRISNGGIILLHDGIQQTVDVLPDLIRRIKKMGFRFVTIEEMDREKQ